MMDACNYSWLACMVSVAIGIGIGLFITSMFAGGGE